MVVRWCICSTLVWIWEGVKQPVFLSSRHQHFSYLCSFAIYSVFRENLNPFQNCVVQLTANLENSCSHMLTQLIWRSPLWVQYTVHPLSLCSLQEFKALLSYDCLMDGFNGGEYHTVLDHKRGICLMAFCYLRSLSSIISKDGHVARWWQLFVKYRVPKICQGKQVFGESLKTVAK